MKKITYIRTVIILFLGFVLIAQAQEIQKIVNSPEALHLLDEIARTDSARIPS